MYTPSHFKVADRAWVVELIERHPFGLLVTAGEEYPRVSHVPMVAQERGGELWVLGHVARANAHARSIEAGESATLVFEGPHAYVSAAWYEEPYATVPTWNYTAAHVCGKLREFDAWQMVKLLSFQLEGDNPAWDPRKLDPAYVATQVRAIVAFELRADAVYAKAKLSQNRTHGDRVRVAQKLCASADQTERETGEAMSALLEREER
jgi:transcriptional regulator